MPAPTPSFRPRPGGGFSQGMGSFGEHLDENAMQAAAKQKSLTQQQSSTTPQSGKGGTNPLLSQTNPMGGPMGQQGGKGTFQPAQPREVGSLVDELVFRPGKDAIKGIMNIFDINTLLGIGPTDTPEQQQKKKQFHQRYQKLTEEEKQEAQKQYQMRMQQKKQEKEQEEAKKQREAQQKQQSAVAPPPSTKKGPVGPGSGQSKKGDAVARMQQQRQQLSNPGAQH